MKERADRHPAWAPCRSKPRQSGAAGPSDLPPCFVRRSRSSTTRGRSREPRPGSRGTSARPRSRPGCACFGTSRSSRPARRRPPQGQVDTAHRRPAQPRGIHPRSHRQCLTSTRLMPAASRSPGRTAGPQAPPAHGSFPDTPTPLPFGHHEHRVGPDRTTPAASSLRDRHRRPTGEAPAARDRGRDPLRRGHRLQMARPARRLPISYVESCVAGAISYPAASP